MYRPIKTPTDKNHSINLNSPALPGSPMSLKAFKEWISQSENGKTISVNEARQKWETMHWWKNKKLTSELDRRYSTLESGDDKGYSMKELEASLNKLRKKKYG